MDQLIACQLASPNRHSSKPSRRSVDVDEETPAFQSLTGASRQKLSARHRGAPTPLGGPADGQIC